MTATVLQGIHAAIDAAFAERSAELAQRAIELDQREADLASAAELLAIDSRVSAALAQGQAMKQAQLSTLIDLQLEHLAPKAAARIILLNLKKLITEA
jgi:hypothetical protein